MSNNYSLTSNLVGGLKWSGKRSFLFFIIAIFAIAGTINSADPVLSDYYLVEGRTQTLTQTALDNDDLQIGLSILEGRGEVTLTILRVEYKSIIDNETIIQSYKTEGAKEIFTQVFQMTTSQDLFERRTFDSGVYKFVATSTSSITIVFGESQIDRGLFTLSLIFTILFLISFSIFWIIFPFAIIVMTINAISGNNIDYSKNQNKTTSKKYLHHTGRSSPIMKKCTTPFFSENSIFYKLTNQDWIWLSLALFSFIMIFVAPDGPFFFISVAVIIGVFYGVTEREKMKDRIVILLEHYPLTSVEFLTSQLGKKKPKDVIKVLQIMILDEGLPIRLNLTNNMVSLIGQIPESYKNKEPVSYSSTSPQPASHSSSNHTQSTDAYGTSDHTTSIVGDTPSPPINPTAVEELVVDKVKKVSQNTVDYCTGCGENIISGTSYCYSCGQKI